jgi:DNA-binding cell septation regulator SpoVG
MAWNKSSMAAALITFLNTFVVPRNLGVITGEQGTFRLFANLARVPDVAFTN